MNFSKAVKEFRKGKKLSKKQFSDAIGISKKRLIKIENGDKKISNKLIHKICDHYKIPASSLVFLALEDHDIKEGKSESFANIRPVLIKLILDNND